MSSGAILLFLGREGIDRWVRIDGGRVAESGADSTPPPANGEAVLPVTAVVPGEEVALHWLDVPAGLAPAQAAAAARLMATELSAEAAERTHVAVGPEAEGRADRCVALVSAGRMADWLRICREAGFEPETILPEPLLLPVPSEGIARFDRGDIADYRAEKLAFTMEGDLAALLLNGGAIHEIGTEALETGFAEAVASPAVNLRQGSFARRARWKIDWKHVRRLALLAVLLVLATFAIQFAAMLRYTYAADAAETEAQRIAAAALPSGISPSADPVRQLEALLRQAKGPETSFSIAATGLFQALRSVPDVQLSALTFDSGALRASVLAESPTSVAALVARIEAAGFVADAGPLSSRNGQQVAELTVRMP